MFVVSKLLSAITQPMFWLAVWMLVALVLLGKRKKLASGMLWTGMLFWGLLGFNAVPDAMLRSLENWFPVPNLSQSNEYLGVVVLGGATGSPAIFKAHGQVPLGDAAERMTLPIGLMRKLPNFKLIFSGGEVRLVPRGTT